MEQICSFAHNLHCIIRYRYYMDIIFFRMCSKSARWLINLMRVHLNPKYRHLPRHGLHRLFPCLPVRLDREHLSSAEKALDKLWEPFLHRLCDMRTHMLFGGNKETWQQETQWFPSLTLHCSLVRSWSISTLKLHFPASLAAELACWKLHQQEDKRTSCETELSSLAGSGASCRPPAGLRGPCLDEGEVPAAGRRLYSVGDVLMLQTGQGLSWSWQQ